LLSLVMFSPIVFCFFGLWQPLATPIRPPA
jgi:hypothetical protein